MKARILLALLCIAAPFPLCARAVAPVLGPVLESCDCLFRKGVEAVGETMYVKSEERNRMIRELLQGGSCPNPLSAAAARVDL